MLYLSPIISLATYYKLKAHRLNEIQKIVEREKDGIIEEWKKYFSKC